MTISCFIHGRSSASGVCLVVECSVVAAIAPHSVPELPPQWRRRSGGASVLLLVGCVRPQVCWPTGRSCAQVGSPSRPCGPLTSRARCGSAPSFRAARRRGEIITPKRCSPRRSPCRRSPRDTQAGERRSPTSHSLVASPAGRAAAGDAAGWDAAEAPVVVSSSAHRCRADRPAVAEVCVRAAPRSRARWRRRRRAAGAAGAERQAELLRAMR